MKSFLCTLFILIILSCFINITKSQELTFCADKPYSGSCYSTSQTFQINYEYGGVIYFLVNKYPYSSSGKCWSIHFKIFKKNDNDKWKILTTEYANYDEQLNYGDWFWKAVNFYMEGEYLVEVYDCRENFICQKKLYIEFK